LGGKRRAGIDDMDVKARDLRHGRQSLTDMNRADDHEARWRKMHVQEERMSISLDGTRLARPECSLNRFTQGARNLFPLDDHAVGAILQIRNKDRCAAIPTALVQFLQ